jgi:nucleoside-diphosphate-sugar epimerase
MNILVTGAAGFLGSHLAERLVEMGHSVSGLDCMLENYALSLKQLNVDQITSRGVVFMPLDLAEDDLQTAVQDVDLVYHFAAQPGLSATASFADYVRNNITATHRLLEVAKRTSTLRGFINIATSSVYGSEATGDETSEPKPTSYYGVTKLAAEQLALAYHRDQGFPACSLRPFSVYGPRERPEKLYPQLIRCILEGAEFPLFEGSEDHVRSYTYVGDVIDGFVAVLENLERCIGEIFNIGTESTITTGEGIRIVEEIIGQSVKTVTEPRRPGDQLRTEADIGKARRMLGYDPSTTPREGLAIMVEWYQEHVVGKVGF